MIQNFRRCVHHLFGRIQAQQSVSTTNDVFETVSLNLLILPESCFAPAFYVFLEMPGLTRLRWVNSRDCFVVLRSEMDMISGECVCRELARGGLGIRNVAKNGDNSILFGIAALLLLHPVGFRVVPYSVLCYLAFVKC